MRLRVLELPGDTEPGPVPFVLILDGVPLDQVNKLRVQHAGEAARNVDGCRGLLAFSEPLDLE